MFEKVALKAPEDKDTQAYLSLLRAMLMKQETSYEKLRDVAPGFLYEVDLWMLQAQLRQRIPAEHAQALKCYMHAKECIEGTPGQHAVPPEVLLNISVLQHSLGKLDKALEYCKRSLQAFGHRTTSSQSAKNVSLSTDLEDAEFEGVFYSWSETICHVRLLNDESDAVLRFHVEEEEEEGAVLDLKRTVSAGSEVVIGEVRLVVNSVDLQSLDCAASLVPLFAKERGLLPLRVKLAIDVLTDKTLAYCFNLARILEDCGNTIAASELYVALLKRHPSFIECTCECI